VPRLRDARSLFRTSGKGWLLSRSQKPKSDASEKRPYLIRRGDKCACSEPADGNTGNKSSAIRKPLHQHGDRNDVSKTEADSTDQAVTKI
jgi:hypothetical protein